MCDIQQNKMVSGILVEQEGVFSTPCAVGALQSCGFALWFACELPCCQSAVCSGFSDLSICTFLSSRLIIA